LCLSQRCTPYIVSIINTLIQNKKIVCSNFLKVILSPVCYSSQQRLVRRCCNFNIRCLWKETGICICVFFPCITSCQCRSVVRKLLRLFFFVVNSALLILSLCVQVFGWPKTCSFIWSRPNSAFTLTGDFETVSTASLFSCT